MLDSFSGRGLTSTSTNQALLGRFNMILDAYRALDVIANHPRIDPTRIAVMGFSRGGQSALYSSLKRFQQDLESARQPSPPTFRSMPRARPYSSAIPM